MKFLCPVCGKWFKTQIHECEVMGESIGLDNSGKIYVREEIEK